MQSRIARCALLLVAVHACATAFAQEAPSARALTQGADVLEFPSVWRILFAFLVAAALAIGAAYALRQLLPRLGKVPLASSRLRVLDRVHLSTAVRVHLVEVEGERVLVAENRGAITMVVLQAAHADSARKV